MTTLIKNEGMTNEERISYYILLTGGLILTIAFGVWWFEPTHIAHNFHGVPHIFDYLFFIILTYIVWHPILMELFGWYVAASVKYPQETEAPEPGLRVAYVTAFVPGSEPYSLLEKTVAAMVQVDYPHDTWLLDEGDDPTAKEICRRYGVHHYSRKGKSEFNTVGGRFAKKTKGGNYNAWLHHYDTSYDIVAQHDIDFIPVKNFLTRTLGYFRDPSVAFVGTPQVYGNLDTSWITRGAAEQTYGFYGPLQKGLYGHDMTLLIGANHIVRMDAYRDIGGYSAHIVEDMLTGMQFYTRKWKSIYVPETLLLGEGPTSWASYFGQQLRWSYGCMDIVFRHCHKLLPKMSPRRIFNYVLLQQFYFIGIAQAIGIVLLTLYFFFGITSASMAFLPLLFLYVPLLIYQQLFQLWIQRFNIQPENEKGFLLRGKVLFISAWPIYFLAFVGALRGKHLTYVVTPKGNEPAGAYQPSLFIPHLIIGSITLLDILVGISLHHTAGLLIFWASLNTIFMCGFFLAESMPLVGARAKKLYLQYAPTLLKPVISTLL
jgi:cellulose synthase (UDP-forming)